MKKLIHSVICLLLVATANAQTLIAHWDFNNGSTTEKIHGWTPTPASMGSAPTASVGKSGAANEAVKFNGSQNLVYAHDTLLNLKSWTLVALVRPDEFYTGTCQASSILWHGTQFGAQHYAMLYYDNWVDNNCATYYPDSMVFHCAAAGSASFPQSDWTGITNKNPRIQKGQWYCVIGTYNHDSGFIDFYVDGILRTSEHGPAPNNWPNQYSYPVSSQNDLYIGSQNNPAGSYPYWMTAAIDDIKIYKGVVSNIDSLCAVSNPPDTMDTPDVVRKIRLQDAISIYPNPARSMVQIQTPVSKEHTSITLTNAVGVVMQQLEANKTGITNLHIAELPAGIYIITVEQDGEIVRRRLVKQ
jgi:hypothetical protein